MHFYELKKAAIAGTGKNIHHQPTTLNERDIIEVKRYIFPSTLDYGLIFYNGIFSVKIIISETIGIEKVWKEHQKIYQ